MATDSLKGIETGRAEFAYRMVLEAKTALGDNERKYKSYVKKIPMLIKTNGLGATFAFIFSKKKEGAYRKIYEQTALWLHSDKKQLLNIGPEDDLAKVLVALESAQYRAATVEVLSLFMWLRRFAEGLIEGEDEND